MTQEKGTMSHNEPEKGTMSQKKGTLTYNDPEKRHNDSE